MSKPFVHPELATIISDKNDEKPHNITKLVASLDQSEASLNEMLNSMPPTVFVEFASMVHGIAQSMQQSSGPERAIGSMLMISLCQLAARISRDAEDQHESGNLKGWWFVVIGDDEEPELTDTVDAMSVIMTAAPTREEAEEDLVHVSEKLSS